MEVYIGLEGYMLPQGYIVKELVILHTNDEYDHYILEAPKDLVLSPKDSYTIRWVTKNLNQLSYSDGFIPYNALTRIFQGVCNMTIYTHGCIATDFIQKYLPTTIVINTHINGFKLPELLPAVECSRFHPARYCAKAKAKAIKDYVETSKQ